MGLPLEAPRKARPRTHLRVVFRKDGRVIGGVVSASGRVRWGPSLGIELSYPVPGVAEREELFLPDRRGARLMLRDGMAGEIAGGGSRLPLQDLAAWGLVHGRKGRRWVVLTREMEGRIEYRGVVYTFGFGGPVARKEEAPSLGRMPFRFRKGILTREDWPFAILTWGLYGVLLAAAVHLASLPLSKAPQPDQVARRFARLIYEAPQAPTPARTELLKRAEQESAAPEEPAPEAEAPEPDAAPAPEPSPQETPPAAEKQTPEPAPSAVPEGEGGAPPGPQRSKEEIRKAVANKGLLGLLGGRGETSTARRRGSLLEGGGVAEDFDRVLENVEGLRAAPTGGGGDGLGTGLPQRGGGIDDVARQVASTAPRAVQLEKREDLEVESAEEPELEELNLKEAVAAIHRVVGTYLGGIRYLYNRELRKNPDLEGKLTVSITITPSGEVSECHVEESTLDSPTLTEAVLARIRKWKFPPVAARDITVSYPFVFFPSM